MTPEEIHDLFEGIPLYTVCYIPWLKRWVPIPIVAGMFAADTWFGTN